MNFGKYEGQNEFLNPPSDIFETYFSRFGGETRTDVRERTLKTYTEIVNNYEFNNAIVVSYVGACLHFLRNFETNDYIREKLPKSVTNGTVIKVIYNNGQFHLEDAFYIE